MAPSIDPGGLRPRRAPGASAPRRPVIELLRLLPPTIAHLEDPQLADELAQARTVGTEQVQATQVIEILAAIASSRLLAVSSAVVLAGFRWWAPVVLAAVWAVSNQWYRRESARMVSSLEGSTASFRRARYSSDLALGGAAAKEIRIFGLAPWLADRFERQWRRSEEHT